MKVWIITVDEVQDFASYGTKPRTYTDRERAVAEFRRIVSNAKEGYKEDIENGWAVEETEDSFLTYEEGYCAENHCQISLWETETDD